MKEFPPNHNDETPFNDKLVESEISRRHAGRGKLYEFENGGDKIIRVENFDDLEERYKGDVDPVVIAGLGKKLYGELEQNYGIAVPVEYIVGKNSQGQEVVYGVTDKVEGDNLDKIKVTPEITKEVEKLYSKISQYYLDQLSKEEPYLADVNNASQYVYGKRKGDTLPRIYLVDTDLYIRDGKVALYNIVLWLARHMISVERKYNKKFDQARKNIEQILREPLPQSITKKGEVIVKKIIIKTRGYLDGSLSIGSDDAHPLFDL